MPVGADAQVMTAQLCTRLVGSSSLYMPVEVLGAAVPVRLVARQAAIRQAASRTGIS